MINNREIYLLQKEIKELRESIPEIDLTITTGIKFQISKSDFAFDQTLDCYTTILKHNLNQEVEGFSISFYDENKNSLSFDYRIVDENSIEIHSDEPLNFITSIKQSVEASHHKHDSSDIIGMENIRTIEFDLFSNDFKFDNEAKVYKAFLNHRLNNTVKNFMISFYSSNNSKVILDYRQIDVNSIEIYSDEPIYVCVVIKRISNNNETIMNRDALNIYESLNDLNDKINKIFEYLNIH